MMTIKSNLFQQKTLSDKYVYERHVFAFNCSVSTLNLWVRKTCYIYSFDVNIECR